MIRSIIYTEKLPIRLSDLLASKLCISKNAALGMINLGSVYYLPSNEYNQDQFKHVEEGKFSALSFTECKVETDAPSSKIKPRRSLIDLQVQPNDFVKVYLEPKRFPIANIVDWKSRVLIATPDFLVIDKPEGLPSHGLVDNFNENVLEKIRENIGEINDTFGLSSLNHENDLPEGEDDLSLTQTSDSFDFEELKKKPYYKFLTSEKIEQIRLKYSQRPQKRSNKILSSNHQRLRKLENFTLPQRLDADTGGLLIVARNPKSSSRIGKLSLDNKIQKKYHALIAFQGPPLEEGEPSVSSWQELLFDSANKEQFILCNGQLNLSDSPRTLKDDTAPNTQLLNLLARGQVLKSFLENTYGSPKNYFWNEQVDKDLLPCYLRLTGISKVVCKTRAEWGKHFDLENIDQNPLKSDIEALRNLESVSSEVTRRLSTQTLNDSKLQMAMHDWVGKGHPEDRLGFVEVEVGLITGRTHQIRGQFQAFQRLPFSAGTLTSSDPLPLLGHGIHLAGDNLYPGVTSNPFDHEHSHVSPYLCLKCTEISIELQENHNLKFTSSPPWWRSIFSPIGPHPFDPSSCI